MKTPESPTRFHTSRRTYHRSQPGSADWNAWVDGKTSSRSPGKSRPWLPVTAAIAAAALIGFLAFWLL